MTHVEHTMIPLTDGNGRPPVELEARWDLPAAPRNVVVLCHPHPLQRGSMYAPLMQALADAMVAHDFAVLRFNFRGVGDSTGQHDFGEREQDDVAAAVGAAADTYSELPLGVAGWSFGAVTSLHWQARDQNGLPWVGIALPVNNARSRPLPPPEALPAARRTVILGDRDQFTTVAETEEYTTAVGAELRVLPGSDHFFYFREERVAAWLVSGLRDEA